MAKEFNPIKEIEPIDIRKFEYDDPATRLFDLEGVIQTVDSEPTGNPTKFDQQFKIYKSGSTRRFYWYDTLNSEWVYVGGTV